MALGLEMHKDYTYIKMFHAPPSPATTNQIDLSVKVALVGTSLFVLICFITETKEAPASMAPLGASEVSLGPGSGTCLRLQWIAMYPGPLTFLDSHLTVHSHLELQPHPAMSIQAPGHMQERLT